jgi:hypothetical protein
MRISASFGTMSLHHAGHRGNAPATVVEGIEDRFLVFLHVLGIGERQALHDGEKGGEGADDAAGLARTSSAASGLRFCGMIDEPVVNLSDSFTKRNCGVDQITISSASRDR